MNAHEYRPDIDGLRALAVVPVVLYHAGFPVTSGGFVGVDVFFVISGYLITGIIVRELSQGRFSLLSFYERRARRILPALFTVVTATLLVGWFLLPSEALKSLANSAIASVFSLSNVYFWRQSGYFAPQAELFPLLHTWSLGVEEQFYIVFPILVVSATRLRRFSIVSILTMIVLVSLIASILASYRYPSANFFLIPTRAWEIGVGSLLAIVKRPVPRSGVIRLCASLMGLLMIISAVLFYDKNTIFPGVSALLPCFGAVLLIWTGAPQCGSREVLNYEDIVTKFLSTRALVLIGSFSYSLYLWHWPILVYLRNISGQIDLPWNWAIMGVALSLVVSYFGFTLIEQPFRDRNFISGRMIGIMSVASSVLLVSACLIISFVMQGAPFRVPASASAAISASRDFDSSCMNVIPSQRSLDERSCIIGSENFKPSFILMGDSHSAALRPALAVWAEHTERSGYFQSFNACPPVNGVMFGALSGNDYANCDRAARETLRLVLSNESIDTVFLTAYWEGFLERVDAVSPAITRGKFYHKAPRQTLSQSHDVVLKGLGDVVRLLKGAGKKVVIIQDLPEPPTDIPWSIANSYMIGIEPKTLFFLDNEVEFYSQVDEMARIEGAKILRPSELFCDATSHICDAIQEGLIMFRDNNHITSLGARRVIGPWLIQELDKF